MIRIIEVKNPFDLRTKTMREVACTGETLYKYIENLEQKQAFLNGVRIERPEHCFPQDGNEIIIMPLIEHGFKKWFGVIATIGLAFAGAHMATWGIWGKTLAGKTLAGLFSGLVMTVGGKIINSVFHLNTGKNAGREQETSQTYSWNLPTIQTNEGGVIGETYGECIPAPQLLMEHVETVGNDQYLNLLLCGGYGPVDAIYDLRIGNTAIGNFQDVMIETRLGTNDQSPISFLQQTVSDESIGVEVKANSPINRTTSTKKANRLDFTFEFPSGLYSIDDNGNTKENTVKFLIEYRKHGEIEWKGSGYNFWSNASGITNITIKEGAVSEVWTFTPVTEEVREPYRRRKGKVYYKVTTQFGGWDVIGSVHGKCGRAKPDQDYSNDYISFHVGNNLVSVHGSLFRAKHKEAITVTVVKGEHVITASSTSTVRKTISIPNLEPAQYDVRITGIDLPSSTRKVSYMQWSLLSTYINDSAYSRPGKVLVGLRIKATNQLSGGLPNVNWRQARNTVYVWNPKKNMYESKSARNPIWAAYDILHNCKLLENINTGKSEYVVEGSNKENFTDYYDEWVTAAAYADELVEDDNGGKEARFEFDAFYDTTQTRFEAANKAAAVGHASIVRHGTSYGITVDKPGEIVQIFGEGQVIRGGFQGEFLSRSERARSVECTYSDAENDFKNTCFLLRSPTYTNDLKLQDNTAKLALFGVKRRSQAYREAVYTMACNERQIELITFPVDVNAIVCEYGNIIGVNHSVPQLGEASGRIISVDGNVIKLDKKVHMIAGDSYSIMISLSKSDKIIKKDIVNTTSETDTLIATTEFVTGEIPEKFDPYAFGRTSAVVKPYRITKITQDGDLKVKITGIEYDESIYRVNYDNFPILDYSPVERDGKPTDINLWEENYITNDGVYIHHLYVSWKAPVNESPSKYRIYISKNGHDWQYIGDTRDTEYDITKVAPPQRYYVKVTSVVDIIETDGLIGILNMNGKDEPPDIPTGLKAEIVTDNASQVRLSWNENTDPDIRGYNIYVNGVLKEKCVKDTFYTFIAKSTRSYTFEISAVDNAGNESTGRDKVTQNVKLEPGDVTGFKAIQSMIDRVRLQLRWNAPNEKGITYYVIKMGQSWDTGTVVAPYVTGVFYDMELTDENWHTFMIKAVGGNGYESEVAATVDFQHSMSPTKVPDVQAFQDPNDRSILRIQWTGIDDGDLAGYLVKVGDNWDAGEPLPFTRELYTSYNLTRSGSFKIMIKAKNMAGYYSEETSCTVEPMVEAADVTGLVAYKNGDAVDLYWDMSTDADVVGYEIREGYAWDESSLITTGVIDTNYRVAITTERAYRFFVKAKNSSGYYSLNPARVSIVVTELTPKNVIFTYDEIVLANGTFNSTEIGASHWTWQNYGGKFSDYPDTKFSEIGGSNVLKLLVGADGKYPFKGWYYPKNIDIGSIITCYVSCLFTSTATKKGGSATLYIRTSQDGTKWTDWEIFKPIQRTFRYVGFRVNLETKDTSRSPEVNQFTVSIDVPDTDIAMAATIAKGGTTVNYGHTFFQVPVVVPAAVGENLHAELVNKDKTSCILKIKDRTNADVGGKADIRIKGF